jgi:putative DNA primase/helicase
MSLPKNSRQHTGDRYLRSNLTELALAERFADEHGADVRYCHVMQKWFVYDGTRWILDQTGMVDAKAKQTVLGLYGEAAGVTDDSERAALVKFARQSERKQVIANVLHLARSESGIPIAPAELDRDPWLLNCKNGNIDLRTGELRKHRRSDLITKIAPVEYDPHAEAPTFEGFLERILPSKPLRGFVRRVIGYAASGDISEEILTILHGTGANGKSTLLNAVMDALGEYAQQAAPDLLLSKRGSHPTELADLFGARFVASVETDEGRRLAEGLVKQLTGRDPIKARRMHEDFWQFDPTHTLFLGTNHRPEIRGTDGAIWRRVKAVPFDVVIPDEEQDKRLADKLRAELPGVLAWIVRGCLEYQRHGLGEPDEVTQATQGYRADMDVLATFIEECCVVHPSVSAGATPLYTAYVQWCEENGETAVKQTRFGLQLRERGFTDGRDSATRRKVWKGIGLFADNEPPDDGRGSKQWQGDTNEAQPDGVPKQFGSAKPSGPAFVPSKLDPPSRGEKVQKRLRTLSEAPTVSESTDAYGPDSLNKRHSQDVPESEQGAGEGKVVGEKAPLVILCPSPAERSERVHSENGDCIHGYAGGAGCYLCDPTHPYRTGGA